MDPFLASLEAQVSTLAHGEEIEFDAAGLYRIEEHGYEASLGLGLPGTKHYRRTKGPDNAMHLKVLGSKGTLHREHVNPHEDLLGHLKEDMKLSHWFAVLLSGMGLGAALWWLSKKG